ncbi:MAG: AraC family transcriptional regulator [Hyphomicrobiales bacterium]|nr:MAG: AraC family transcriptional regulator [Hyphomicrobiales bacterium]
MLDLEDLKQEIARFTSEDGIHATGIEGLTLIRFSKHSEPTHGLIEPALCIVAQGKKRTIAGDRMLSYDASKFLVVSAETPIIGQIVEASPEAPYLCLKLDLEAAAITELLIDVGGIGGGAAEADASVSVSLLTPELIDAATRLVRLLGSPDDIRVLAPMVRREILYRVLQTDQATRLQQIALAESRLQQVNRAIGWIKSNYRQSFAIEEVAMEARMSPSSLHLHFKAVTAMSPLQYQKQLRLQEARRLMLGEALDAATAGHRVGYDSPSQFSREYARTFGAPPLRDVARLKAGDLLAAG